MSSANCQLFPYYIFLWLALSALSYRILLSIPPHRILPIPDYLPPPCLAPFYSSFKSELYALQSFVTRRNDPRLKFDTILATEKSPVTFVSLPFWFSTLITWRHSYFRVYGIFVIYWDVWKNDYGMIILLENRYFLVLSKSNVDCEIIDTETRGNLLKLLVFAFV